MRPLEDTRLKHGWGEHAGSPEVHNFKLTPCLPPDARERHRAPRPQAKVQHLSHLSLPLSLTYSCSLTMSAGSELAGVMECSADLSWPPCLSQSFVFDACTRTPMIRNLHCEVSVCGACESSKALKSCKGTCTSSHANPNTLGLLVLLSFRHYPESCVGNQPIVVSSGGNADTTKTRQ